MTCEEIERDELVEQYVLGRLEEDEQNALEDHYFNCSACLERLRVIEATRAALTVDAARSKPSQWRRVAAGLAAAATLVLAVRAGQLMWGGPDDAPAASPPPAAVIVAPPAASAPAPRIPATLGEIQLPPYTPVRLRSTTTEAQRVFREAMGPYVAGECGAAMEGLRRSLQLDESLLQARFYLSACEIQSERLSEAESNLQRIIAAGESPYLEDALFFLAKVRIRTGDIAGARQELTRVMSLQGERREEARRLLDQLR